MGLIIPGSTPEFLALITFVEQTGPPVRAAEALPLTYLPTLSHERCLATHHGGVAFVPEPVEGHSVLVLEHVGGVVYSISAAFEVLDPAH